jgi:cysteine-rich repeat protein
VVTITPDDYGSETTWQIANSNGVPIAGGGPYRDGRREDEITPLNLPELPLGECYKFTIFDARNDGLCCGYGQGSYGLTFSGAAVTSSATFTGSQESQEFGCNNVSNPSPRCGNGIVEAGEECDDGNNNNNDGCSNQCTINAANSNCGNGVVDTGEECDDGNNNNNGSPPPECGNGVLEAGEQCDDGNDSDYDACTNACRNNVCGDGFLRTGVEECDDGNNNGSGDCRNDCTTNDSDSCGDTFWERWWNQIRGRC